jgi:putative DNA primase/helicase
MAVVPARADGSKRPVFEWKEFQGERPTWQQIAQWYTNTPEWGVGLICGAISGNLEMLEIESCRMGGEWLDLVRIALVGQGVEQAWDDLFEQGYVEFTPSGGIHILYQISDQPVPGNQKIAMSKDSKITYAETRGEGGFTIVAPTCGTVHPSGDSWEATASSKVGERIPAISWDTRCRIHAALKTALDERVLPAYERPAGFQAYDRANGDRPGDAFNDDPNVTIHDILVHNGWRYLGRKQGQDEYVHPQSSNMATGSARTGYQGSPNLYAWSGMPQEGSYDKFAVLTHLEHNGDFSAASRWLRGQGYGSDSSGDSMEDWVTDPHVGVDSNVAITSTTSTASADAPVKPHLEQFTEKGVGRFAAKLFGGMFRSVYEERGWRVYDNGAWVTDKTKAIGRAMERVSDRVDLQVRKLIEKAEAALREGLPNAKEQLDEAKKMKTFAKGMATDRGLKAIASRMADQPGVAVDALAFDKDPNLLCLANGTFDMKSMTLRQHSPDDMLTRRIDVAYDAEAVGVRWERFISEVLPNPTVAKYVQRAVGMTLLGRMEEAAFFLIHGKTGCGKSQFLKVISAAMGEYAATAASTTFQSSRGESRGANNDLHDLRGVRFASISETAEGASLDEALIKSVTGGDPVRSRGLYQDFQQWKPRFTVWMATNFLPRLNSDDGAIWRRVKPVEFPTSFADGERTPEIGLAEKIIDAELPGVFNWIIEGAKMYLTEGLGHPDEVREAVTAYRIDTDPVSVFVTEAVAEGRMEKKEDATATSSEIYRCYAAWCHDNSQRPIAERRFSMRLSNLGFGTSKGASGVRMRTGLKINPNYGFAAAQTPANGTRF